MAAILSRFQCVNSLNHGCTLANERANYDDVIKWEHFPRYRPFVRGIHRSPVNSPHKGQWRGALMFSLICARINAWVNNSEAGGLRRNHSHYDVTVMQNFDVSQCLITGHERWGTGCCKVNAEMCSTSLVNVNPLCDRPGFLHCWKCDIC